MQGQTVELVVLGPARRLLAILVVTVGAGMLATPALAARVEVLQQPCDRYGQCQQTISFAAANGEVNSVSISMPSGEIADAGAAVTAGQGCQQLGPSRVRCPHNPVQTARLDVSLGDGDDSAAVAGPVTALLQGGPGDDQLTGGDLLIGGPGGDALRGGDGITVVSYAERREPVVIDLMRAAPQGAAGENDTFTDIDNVMGGRGDDTIRGDGGANELDGRGGDDRVAGRAGDDSLEGGRGVDRLNGGRGHDFLSLGAARGPRREKAVCGAGVDRLRHMARLRFVDPSCERLVDLGIGSGDYMRQALKLRNPRARFLRAGGQVDCDRRRCLTRTVKLARRRGRARKGTLLGSTVLSAPRGGERRDPGTRLNRTGQRLLRRYRRLRIVVRLRYRDPSERLRVVYVTELRLRR